MKAHQLTVAAALLATALSTQGQRSAAPLLATAPAPLTPLPAAAPQRPGLAALDCMIQPHQVVQVGSPAPGVIDHVLVDRGDVVKRGQPVVQLNATVERAALEVARERAAQTGDATVAISSRDLAQSELMRAEELHRQQFVSRTYLDKLRSEAGVAEGRSDQARERKSLSTREAELAAAQLEQRTVRAPISGVVLERLMSPGEYVDQKPMLRIAAVHPLRVDVLVPAAAFGHIRPGMVARVTPELLNRNPHTATVSTVDGVIDAASNTFRVRLELPNPGNALPAGLRCKVDLTPQATSQGTGQGTSQATSAAPATTLPAGAPGSKAGPQTAAAPTMKPAAAAPAAALQPGNRPRPPAAPAVDKAAAAPAAEQTAARKAPAAPPAPTP